MKFQSKIRSAVTVLNALDEKAPQQIIHILNKEPGIDAARISEITGLELNTVNYHLQSLSNTKVVMIQEEKDQALFSVDRDRLAKVNNIVKRFAQK